MHSPPTLRAAASLLLLSIPLAGIQVMLGTRALWWRPPVRELAIACGVALLLSVPTTLALLRGRRTAWSVAVTFAIFWLIASLALAVRESHTVMGYFTLLLAGFLYVTLNWIRFELARSFLDPRQAWYQGLPKGIAGLGCKVGAKGEMGDFRVCRIDSEGAFVFAPATGAASSAALVGFIEPVDLTFSFRDHEIKCRGAARARLASGSGTGFQFVDLSPDLGKEIGDFVEMLRGEGYVD